MTAGVWLAAALCGIGAALALRPARRPADGAGASTTVMPGARAAASSGVTEARSPRAASGAGPTSPAVSAVGAASGVWFLVGGWPGVPVGAVAGVLAWRVLSRREPTVLRRRREALERGVPLTVDLLAASLSVGSAPAAALARVLDAVDPPLRDELRTPVARLRLGADPVVVWAEMARHPQLGPIGRCLLRATESGAPVADALQRLSADQRHQARTEVEARARAVGVKAAAPLGLCLLPAFVLLGIVPLIAGLLPVLLGG